MSTERNRDRRTKQKRDQTPASPRAKRVSVQQRVTRARVEYRKLLEFDGLSGPLWIRRVLVELRALRGLRSARPAAPGAGRKRPDASNPGGATRSAMRD